MGVIVIEILDDEIFLTFYGEPVSKQRPRMGKNGQAYTPKRTRDAEAVIADRWSEEVGGKFEPEARLGVSLQFVCANRRRKDLDNMAKLVLDALNGVAYDDDSQIDRLDMERVFTRFEPATRIAVWRIDE